MKKSRGGGPVPISDIVTILAKQLGKRLSDQERVEALWEKGAGAKRVAHAKVSAFEGGVLTVDVDNSGSLYELTLEKEKIFEKLKKLFQKETLREIRFQLKVGKWQKR